MGPEEEVEHEDRWLLGWRGLHVQCVNESATETVLVIGDQSKLTVLTPRALTVRPTSNEPTEPASPDALVGDEVLSGVAFKTGALRLVFRSGLRLDIAREKSSWKAVGNSGRTWTSGRDGLVTTAPNPR